MLEKLIADEKEPFKKAALSFASREKWSEKPVAHQAFYRARLQVDGETVTGKELIEKYANEFPADREYSTKAHLRRMLSDVGIEEFTYSQPKVLEEMLLSAHTRNEWAKMEPTLDSFGKTKFTYKGRSIKGQMLLRHLAIEDINNKHGTYFAPMDTETDTNIGKCVNWRRNSKFLRQVFDTAGIESKTRLVKDMKVDDDKLREILLSKMDNDEWSNWEGNGLDFRKLQFDIPGYRNFSGESLQKAYSHDNSVVSLDELRRATNIPIGEAVATQRREDGDERLYGIYSDPAKVRSVLLQVHSERDWLKPKKFDGLRGKKVNIEGREVSLHYFMMLKGVAEYNHGRPLEERLNLDRIQQDDSLKHLATSNRNILDGLLEYSGLRANWIANISDYDLQDNATIRKFLLNAEYQGQPISPDGLKQLSSREFRKVEFTDPETECAVKGHALMLAHSAYDSWSKQDGVNSLMKYANKGHGKSNSESQRALLETAGF